MDHFKDYYTVEQAKERTEEFLQRYPLTENQKLSLEDATVSRKLVRLVLEKPLYPRILCQWFDENSMKIDEY